MPQPTIAAYVYSGWHPCAERDAHFGKGWTEWNLVQSAARHFDGHELGGLPLEGTYDDRDPAVHEQRMAAARAAGVDVFVFGWFWSRGKKVFEEAIDSGWMGARRDGRTKFAVMWANRMPHRVLPLRRLDPTALPPYRRVFTDADDFCALVDDCAGRYFACPDYWRLDGKPYLSIFDSSLFVRQLGFGRAAEAIARAKTRSGGLHLAAIDPEPRLRPHVRDLGFDSVTHYVSLPEWKGPRLQDYATLARARLAGWDAWAESVGVPYHPSVAPGWDATPRASLHAKLRPDRYPWTPVVTDSDPAKFGAFAEGALRWSLGRHGQGAPVFVASWNEWSEGHAIEAGTRFGSGWLDALAAARRRASAQISSDEDSSA